MSSTSGHRSVAVRGRSSETASRSEMVVTVAPPPKKAEEPAKSALKPASRTPSPSTTPRPAAAAQRTDINLDNFETMEPIKAVVNSPRSLQVCGRFGVHPTELVHRPLNQFSAPGVPQAVAKMRYEHYEKIRQKKLVSLREERHCMPEVAPPTLPHRPASPAKPVATTNGTSAAAARPRSAPPPQRRTASPVPTPKPQLTAAQAPPPSARTAVNPVALQRAKAILEANARRDEAKRRSLAMKQAREEEALTKQRQREEKSRALVQGLLEKKLCDVESQRLKRADAMDHVKQLSRIKEYNAGIRAAEWERKVSTDRRDPFSILSARELYRTPQQRVERARSASAPRTTPVAA